MSKKEFSEGKKKAKTESYDRSTSKKKVKTVETESLNLDLESLK